MALHRVTKTSQKSRRALSRKRTVAGSVKARTSDAAPRIAQLFETVSDKHGRVLVDLVASNFGMSKIQIVETAGISRAAMYKPKRLQSIKVQERMREMLEIVSRVSDWAGGATQAMAWYRAEPLPPFGGRTAEALVKEGKAAAVRDYLDVLALGNFA